MRGVTLLEVMLALGIVGILVAIAVPAYQNYQDKLKTARAVSDIASIQASVATFAVDNQGFPLALADVSPALGAMRDPWGNPYQYVSHDDVKGKGKFRKDKNIVPINSDFDLWSMGPDGASVPPLTGKSSRDDIVRANNGRFIGVAAEYDP